MTTGADHVMAAVRLALSGMLAGAKPPPRILIGLSGGMDSVVLLHALSALREEVPFPLSAVHVHHGQSPDADAWADFCMALCAQIHVPCEVVRLRLAPATGKGLERVAREARYAAFVAATGDVLCLAHHQNDRAETFLLNLLRGASGIGLAGVPPARMLAQKRLLRPFIDLPRETLAAWAADRCLRWVDDESNQDLYYRRNYLRHRVLPVMAAAFPGVISVLSRTARHMGEQLQLLHRLAQADAAACRDAAGFLQVSRLQTLPELAVRNVLSHALFTANVRIPAARRLMSLSAQLMSARVDATVFVRMGSVGVHLWRDHVWLDDAMNRSLPAPYVVGAAMSEWPDGTLSIVPPMQQEPLQVRALAHGQHFHPVGRRSGAVSELLRAAGVPPWVRPRLPGLWSGDTLLWVAGLGWADAAPERLIQAHGVTWQAAPITRL